MMANQPRNNALVRRLAVFRHLDVRYVQLPLEDHGYTARESRQHVLWEMITWLDKFVKQPSSSAQTQ